MPTIGPLEIAIVLVIGLLILGPKQLPRAGRSLGEGIRELRTSLSGPDEDAGKAAGKADKEAAA